MKAAWQLLLAMTLIVIPCVAENPKPANAPPPKQDFVTIYGSVVHQGRHALPANQPTTLTQALKMAGGLDLRANFSKVKIIRRTPAGNKTQIVNLVKGGKDPVLNPQDVIIVDEKLESF